MKPWFIAQRADAVSFLSSIPSNSVNLIVTDPAYESLEKHRAIGTTTRLEHWFPIFPNERWGELMLAMYRALAMNSHCYVFCDQETTFNVAVSAGERAGFKFWKALIWDKQRIGMGYHYRAQHEFVLFFEKGKRNIANLGCGDVLHFLPVRYGYPTEKPIELLEILVAQSSIDGDVVCDPFMGSGSTGHAALAQQRNFMGCDIANTAVELAAGRCARFGDELLERPRGELALTA